MTDDGTDVQAISLQELPSPVCHVAWDSEAERCGADEQAVVTTVNDSFESAFGPITAGTSVVETLRSVGIESEAIPSDVGEFVDSNERRLVQRSIGQAGDRATEPYLLRGISSDDRTGGYVVLTSLPARGPRPRPSSNVGLDDVASIISHDLRNPLDVAKARLRAGRELDEDEQFDHVARAHERMERIIDDVLTLADTASAATFDSASNAPAERTRAVEIDDTVHLGDVASAAWDTVETDEASLHTVADLPPAVADEDRLQRLFENLFRNAIEHGSTAPGSPTRRDAEEYGSTSPPVDSQHTVAEDGANSSRAATADADRPPAAENTTDGAGLSVTVGRLGGDPPVGFYVADDGRGIPADERERVFDPGVSSTDHGTGLGLAIVDRIAARHGWSLTVTGADDGGARFEIDGVEFATTS